MHSICSDDEENEDVEGADRCYGDIQQMGKIGTRN